MHKFLACKIQRGNWLTHKTSGSPSFVWTSIEGVKELVAKATCIIVGIGNTIRVREDPWIPDSPHFTPSPRASASLDDIIVVSQLITNNGSAWDKYKLFALFNEESVAAIICNPISQVVQRDVWVWTKTCSIKFSIKSAYWLN